MHCSTVQTKTTTIGDLLEEEQSSLKSQRSIVVDALTFHLNRHKYRRLLVESQH